MLSSKSIGSGGGAASYYENLAREDYYTAGGEPPGKWVGEYAREIGLEGEVRKGELEAGFAGFHPRTGEAIANNAGEDHKAGYDLTFSAPKSLSAVWATADEATRTAISEAQQRAVEKALDYASGHAFQQREGHAGSIRVEHTGGLAAATFEHGTSREGDPQLHTHVLVLNLAENGKRIDFDTSWKHATGAAYRAELAHEMQKLGFEVKRDGSSFKIEGVPEGLTKEFSTRREQIEAALREHNASGGKAAQAAALATRVDKGEVNRAELFERAREVAREHGFNPDEARASGSIEPEKFDSAAFLGEATAQASTLTRQQLEKELFQAAQGSLTIEQAQARLEDLKARGELIELRDSEGGPNRWTTRDMLEVERRFGEAVERAARDQTHDVSRASLEAAMAAKTLSEDQKQALEHIMRGERVAVLQGVAGAGKSYMLDAARDAWQRDGYDVRGAALAGKAAEGLEKSSGIPSATLHSTLFQLDSGQLQLDEKSIVVIDEAGMVGSRQMEHLMQHIDAAGAKLVMVGDTQQLQPIDAGGAMRAAMERAGYVEMSDIRRQQTEEQRQIVRDFKDGRAAEALERLERVGGIRQGYQTAAEARQGMAKAIVEDLRQGKTSIGLAGTRSEISELNRIARAEAQAAGLVAKHGYRFETTAGVREFSKGDRILFQKNDKNLGVRNGTTGTVEAARNGNLTVKLDDGRRIQFGDMEYRAVNHGYAMTVHKSQGVTVDRAHMTPGRMTDQHSAYVGASRHRETVHIHGTPEQIAEMRKTAARDHTKDTSADRRYTPVERQAVAKAQHDYRPAPPTDRQIERLEQARAAFDQRAAELRQAVAERHPEAKPQAKPEAERQADAARPEPKSEARREEPSSEARQQAGQEKPDTKEADRQQAREQPEARQEEARPDAKGAEIRTEAQGPREADPKPEAERQTDAVKTEPEQSKQEIREETRQEKPDAKEADRQQAPEQPEARQEGERQPEEARPDAKEPAAKGDEIRTEAQGPREADPKPEAAREAGASKPEKPAPRPEADHQQAQRATREPSARPGAKQIEQQRQLKSEAERHQSRQPQRQAEQQRQLRQETARQRQPERQVEQNRPQPHHDRNQHDRQHER